MPADALHSTVGGEKSAATQVGIPVEQSISPRSHGLPVLHGAPGVQPMQLPPLSQTPPGHMRPSVTNMFAGHAALDPVQLSAMSHAPLATLHTSPDERKASPGHSMAPAHLSKTSQTPAAARQIVVAGCRPSAGQVADMPLHDSAASHTPADVRQIVPADASASTSHDGDAPEQVSAMSHPPALARHVVPAGTRSSCGHCATEGEQTSSVSQAPAAARHTELDPLGLSSA
jgi:hypothetical protein